MPGADNWKPEEAGIWKEQGAGKSWKADGEW